MNRDEQRPSFPCNERAFCVPLVGCARCLSFYFAKPPHILLPGDTGGRFSDEVFKACSS